MGIEEIKLIGYILIVFFIVGIYCHLDALKYYLECKLPDCEYKFNERQWLFDIMYIFAYALGIGYVLYVNKLLKQKCSTLAH